MVEGSTPFYKRRSVQLLVGVAVSAFFLWVAMKDLVQNAETRRQMIDAFRQADYSTLPAIWGVLFVFYWLKSWRWAMLLSPVGRFAPLRDLFPAVMIGFAFNNLLPAHLGDVVRVFVFAGRRNIPKTAVLSTVVLERVFDIIAILCFLGIGLVFVKGLDPSVHRSALVFGAFSCVIVLAALAYLIWTPWFVRIAEWGMNAVPILPISVRGKIAGMMESGAAGLASLKSFRSLVGITLTSLAQWALNGLQIYLALWSFDIHLSSPLLVSCIVLGVVAFGVTIPSSPGYFGVIQFCFMTSLRLFTDDQASVFAASVYYHLSQYIPVTIVGLIFMGLKGMHLTDFSSGAVPESPDSSHGSAAAPTV
ncbi:MAG: lysylphosphatidylglycerol synthase transmembrane domain-containing protein [Planctomycetaceae bacterium]